MKTLFALFSLLASASLFIGCGGSGPVHFEGRLSFGEDSGCFPILEAAQISWADCHAFKHHFDSETGEPVSAAAYAPGALRPLAATVTLKLLGDGKPCDTKTFQSGLDGVFNVTLEGCEAKSYKVQGQVTLQYQFSDAGTPRGTLRAVWPERMAAEVLSGADDVAQAFAFTDAGGIRYAFPLLTFEDSISAKDVTANETNLGNIVFLGTESSGDRFGYVREVVSAYSTVLELHARAKAKLPNLGDYFAKVFETSDVKNWGLSYTLNFDSDWASSSHANMWLFAPDETALTTAGIEGFEYVLSDVGTLSHEFGHTLHSSYAPDTFTFDYGFASDARDSHFASYSSGHSFDQYQELSTAFIEGLASSIGQYLINGCEGWDPMRFPGGGADPFATNQWNADESCDDDNECNFHHVRAQLSRRSVTEGSATWNNRVTALRALTTSAVGAGHRFVTSNNESRVSQWGCDLLDTNQNVQYALGVVGQSYVPNFTYWVGQTLDGATFSMPTATYLQPPSSDNVSISLETLFDAMERTCPSCLSLPRLPGANYNTARLSATGGRIGAHALAKYLESNGSVTHEQMKNLFRANWMEENF